MFAELAILFTGMFEPFDEAVLVDVLDGTGTEARIKKWLVSSSFTPTDSTNFNCKKGVEKEDYRKYILFNVNLPCSVIICED